MSGEKVGWIDDGKKERKENSYDSNRDPGQTMVAEKWGADDDLPSPAWKFDYFKKILFETAQNQPKDQNR